MKNEDFFLQTYHGHAFYPTSGKISNVEILDIAHALSNIGRFNGHANYFYSVAEHSVLVAKIIKTLWPDDLNAAWAGLLHDATEAYVGDVTTPLKVTMSAFMELEEHVAAQISKEFNIVWDAQTKSRVKHADMVALATEASKLFDDVSSWKALNGVPMMPELLESEFPMLPGHAKQLFVAEYCNMHELRNFK